MITKMTYNELKKIADKNISLFANDSFPDVFQIASYLNIKVKNSIQAKEDFQENNPINTHNAIYALYQGEYTIYYNEHYAYKNFAIAHEIAHHLLGHTSDGADEHHDANLLAAIIIISDKSAKKIKSAEDISKNYKIPIEAAELYMKEKNNIHINNSHLRNMGIVCLITMISVISGIFFLLHVSEAKQEISKPDNHIIENIQYVYITKYGTKYHKSNCRHIKNSDSSIKISIEGAKDAGYDPCKDCIGE